MDKEENREQKKYEALKKLNEMLKNFNEENAEERDEEER